ncbi:MAG: TRAP transporter small permease subunit [Candidatus Eiseniibacteriota bacterium]
MTPGEPRPTLFGRVMDVVVAALNALGTGWIFVIMILINADVLLRYLFNSPIRGVPLIITLSIIAIVFLQLPDALRAKRVTRNDAVIGNILIRRPRFGHLVQSVYHFAGFFLMGLLFFYLFPFFVKDWESDAYSGNRGDFTFPHWPIKLVILIGAAACGIQFLRHVWQDIRTARGAPPVGAPQVGTPPARDSSKDH